MVKSLSRVPRSLAGTTLEYRHRLLAFAVEKENARNPEARIRIVDAREMEGALEVLKKEGGRSRMIVKNGRHYTALDIDYSNPSRLRALLLDAAAAFSASIPDEILKKQGFTVFSPCNFGEEGIQRGIQKDKDSCSLFAFDHCRQLAHVPPIVYDDLEKAFADKGYVLWKELPPNLVWNTQSLSILEEYQKAAEERDPGSLSRPLYEGMSFRDYMEKNVCLYPGIVVPRNEAINLSVLGGVLTDYLHGMKKELQIARSASALWEGVELVEKVGDSDDESEDEDEGHHSKPGPGVAH